MSAVVTEAEIQEVGAVARLAFARLTHPDLGRAEAAARVTLVAAIMAMDEADDRDGFHSLNEQARVNAALTAYGNALADMIRGEAQQ